MQAYMQVHNALRKRIVSGKYPPGHRLPGEHELGEQFKVSRITVRHALKLLAEGGLVERAPGRGTFVLAPREPKLALLNTDFAGSIRKAAPKMKRDLVRREIVVPPGDVAEALGLAAGEECEVVERTDILHGKTLAYDQAYIPLAVESRLDERLLKRLDFLEKWLELNGLEMSCVSESIEAVGADRKTARHLGVRKGAAVLLSREVIYDAANRPLIYFISYYRGDRVKRISTNRTAKA